MAEGPELRLVREHLESVLSPSLAGAALFEALGAVGGRLPRSARDAAFLVEGPLRAVLEERLRAGEADALVADIMAALAPALAREASQAVSAPRGDATLEVPLPGPGEAVRLVVLSAEDTFAARIEGALGPKRVAAVTLRTAPALLRSLRSTFSAPQLLIVDAGLFPPIEPAELAAALAAAPDTVPRAIWGGDLPYGAALLRAAAEHGGRATPFGRSDGVEPILDLVRSLTGRASAAPGPR
jgi:hypothetical protein